MFSSILWVALSRVILGITPLLTLPILTGSFTPEWYGVWAQITTTISFITPLVGMGFDTGVVRYFAAGFDERQRVRDFYSMAVFITLVSLLLILTAFTGARIFSRIMFAKPALGEYAVLTFVWVLTQGLYNYLISYFRVTRNMRTYALFDIANGLSAAGLMIAVPLYFQSVYYMVAGLILNQTLFILIYLVKIHGKLGFAGLSFVNIGKYLKYGLPLVPNSLFLWLVNSSGRYFLTYFKSLEDTGIYAAGFTIANIITLFFMPISFVLFPVISKLWGEGKKQEVAEYIARANRWYLMLAIPGAFGLSFLAKPVVSLLSGREFIGGAEVIFFLTLANVFYGIYQINLYGALLLEKNLRLTAYFALAGVVNVLLNIFLVPLFGLQGAALAMLCSFLFLAGSVFRWTQKVIRFKIDLPGISKIILSAAGMIAGLWVWQQMFEAGGILSLGSYVLIGILVYAVFLFLTKAVTKTELKMVFMRRY